MIAGAIQPCGSANPNTYYTIIANNVGYELKPYTPTGANAYVTEVGQFSDASSKTLSIFVADIDSVSASSISTICGFAAHPEVQGNGRYVNIVYTGTTTPPPTPPPLDIWASFVSFINSIIDWLANILPFSFVTVTSPVNVAYSNTLTLNGITPTDSDYGDGLVAETQCASFIVDSGGAYKFQGVQTKLAAGVTTFSQTVSFTPTVSGKYAQGIACVRRTNTYNYGTQSWGGWTSPVVDANDKGDITVSGPSQPGEPPAIDIFGLLNALIAGIVNWFCTNFGIGCPA
jgi:hypothetical protein